jgi:hypothetical protein
LTLTVDELPADDGGIIKGRPELIDEAIDTALPVTVDANVFRTVREVLRLEHQVCERQVK